MKKIPYEFVFVGFSTKRGMIILGAKNLDALISLVVSAAHDKEKNYRFGAHTKIEADKLGLIPTVICQGRSKKRGSK